MLQIYGVIEEIYWFIIVESDPYYFFHIIEVNSCFSVYSLADQVSYCNRFCRKADNPYWKLV